MSADVSAAQRAAGRSALVLGGSGAVGAEVVRALADAGVRTAFTYFQSAERARALAHETGALALAVDLRQSSSLRQHIGELQPAPDILVHCAVTATFGALSSLSERDWDDAHAINARSVFVALQALGPSVRDIVLVSALDRTQSLPLPLPLAATQGMLSAMAMALAQELGPAARVNLVALGPLQTGLASRLPAPLLDDYRKYSGLQRLGTASEAAAAITWLALENTYMSGKVLAVNGGI